MGVFIDPSEYRRNNLNFQGKSLTTLVELAKQDRIKLLQTDVSQSETKSLIHEHVEKACNQLRKSELSVLKPIDDDRLEIIRNPPDSDELAAMAVASFEEHLAEGKCEVISVSDVNPTVIFNAYSNKEPPFDDTKKKVEFPDAFTLQRLIMWADENESVVYVASADDDLKRVCDVRDQLQHFEKIEAVLDHINQAEDLVQRLHEKPQALIDQLERFVYDNFADRLFVPLYNTGNYVLD